MANGLNSAVYPYEGMENYYIKHLLQVPANHLISASIMAAPAALAMSKLFYPETEPSQTTEADVAKMESPYVTLLFTIGLTYYTII